MTNLHFSFILHAKKGIFCFILLLSCIPTFFMISFALIWKVITFFTQHFLYLPLSSFFSCFYFRASAPTLDLFLLKLSPPFLLIVLFSTPALIPCLFFFQHSSLPNCFYFSWEQFLSYCSAGLCRCYDMSMAFSNTKQTHASVIWHMIRLMVFSKNTVASVIIKILICHMTVPPPSLFPIKQCKGFWPHLNLNFYAPFKSRLKCHLCSQISTPFSSSSSTFIRSGQQLMLIYFIFVLFDFFCLFVCFQFKKKISWSKFFFPNCNHM